MQTGGEEQHGVLKTHTRSNVRVRQRWCWDESETGEDITKFPNHKDERERKENDKRSYK